MQIRTIPWTVCVGVAWVLAVFPGCSDDAPTTASTGTGGAGGAGGAGGRGGGGGSEVVDRGHSASETVTAGEFAKSTKYKMVFTLGQPTQNQGQSISSNYRMRGGLVGAHESAP